jgi:hypothetical protein
MLYGWLSGCIIVYPDSHTASFSFILFFSCFYAERIFVRSAVLSCAGQGALGQEALLWFLQSPGIPYVISL